MNAAVWKFPVPTAGRFTLSMPAGAEILSLQTQQGDPYLWARVVPGLAPVDRRFVIVGTGHNLPDAGLAFIGTFQVAEAGLVFHVFEETT